MGTRLCIYLELLWPYGIEANLALILDYETWVYAWRSIGKGRYGS